MPPGWLLSVVVFLPLAVAAVLLALPRIEPAAARWVWIAATAADLGLVVALWVGYETGGGVVDGIGYESDARWIPSIGSGYHVGVDGLSLPLVALTAVLFLACAVYGMREVRDRVRAFLAGVDRIE